MKKKQVVVSSDDNYQTKRHSFEEKNKGFNRKENKTVGVVSDEKQLQKMMKAQKQKEKQELNSYRRKRDTEKRTRNILLLQSRRVKDGQSLVSVKVFDGYEEHEGTCIWKHNCQRLNGDDCKDCFYGSTPIYSI